MNELTLLNQDFFDRIRKLTPLELQAAFQTVPNTHDFAREGSMKFGYILAGTQVGWGEFLVDHPMGLRGRAYCHRFYPYQHTDVRDAGIRGVATLALAGSLVSLTTEPVNLQSDELVTHNMASTEEAMKDMMGRIGLEPRETAGEYISKCAEYATRYGFKIENPFR